ncbi:TPA: IS3 family transposase [Escherichia coli]
MSIESGCISCPRSGAQFKNDGHYFCRAGGNRPDGLNEPVTSNISELKDAVTEYIEYYNSRRISLKLKGLTPIEYRNQTYMPRV